MKLIMHAKQNYRSTKKDMTYIDIEFDFSKSDDHVVCKIGNIEDVYISCEDLAAVLKVFSIKLAQ